MALHIVKMLGGVSSVDELRSLTSTAPPGTEIVHWTRSTPTRAAEIIGRGSVFWCLKSKVVCRQEVVDIRTIEDTHGKKHCALVLSADVIDVEPRARKPFQGWRYLEPDEAPRDIGAGATGDLDEMPSEMRSELAKLGLL